MDMGDVVRNQIATGSDEIRRAQSAPATPAFVFFKVEFLQFKINEICFGRIYL